MNDWNFHELPYAEFVKNQPKGIRSLAALFELLTYIRIAQSSAEADFVEQFYYCYYQKLRTRIVMGILL